MYYIKNAKVISPLSVDEKVVIVDKEKIIAVCSRANVPKGAKVIDANGLYLSPGFIDIHVHGGGGYSAMSGDSNDVVKMCNAHALHGTTSILPTTLAAPITQLLHAIDGIREAQQCCTDANILGVHLEGPFLSPAQRGAQSEADLAVPSQESIETLLDYWPGGIKLMGAAPEIPGGLNLGRELQKRNIVASIAHSNATYDEVLQAIEAGYTDITHIYSGCSSVIRKNGYRFAGVVEAGLLEDDLSVQVIADLKHLPTHLIRLIYQCKGADNISLITDGLDYSASDLQEGTIYTQKNGVATLYEDHVMKLLDRQSFAGSVATCQELVYNMYKKVGITLVDAVRMATLSPAKCIGIADRKGRIAPGYDADLIIFDEMLDIKLRMVGGRLLQ